MNFKRGENPHKKLRIGKYSNCIVFRKDSEEVVIPVFYGQQLSVKDISDYIQKHCTNYKDIIKLKTDYFIKFSSGWHFVDEKMAENISTGTVNIAESYWSSTHVQIRNPTKFITIRTKCHE